MTGSLAWIFLFLFLGLMLAIDLLVVHRQPHQVKLKESLVWSGIWIALSMLFNLAVWRFRGGQAGIEFLAGYLIEMSLSVDNLFVFLLIFSFFQVPPAYQHRVLFWGIFGAIVMRLSFIVAGVALIQQFHWAIYLFGAILVFSGVKMWSHEDAQIEPDKNIAVRLFRRFFPVTPGYVEGRFFTRAHGRVVATPLFVVLILLETTDLLFAVDSIPAVLAITPDPFIVFSSNAFAILGLRTFYFALAGLMKLFHYLHYGLSFILVFVGIKMLLADVVHVPTWVALSVIGVTLTLCVGLSIARPREPVEANAESLEGKR
jgi:tellurite resistance protein TerC